MPSQFEKAQAFRSLHQRPGAFVIPNPWDAGTARLLASLGFEALATTSAGCAFGLGRPDGEGVLGRDEILANAGVIVAATDLPVSADLEGGFGDEPEACAQTIRAAAAAGLVGGSIEDATGRPETPIHGFEAAVARVRAAAEAARSLPFAFTLTARAENFLHGRADLADTIRRLQAFQEAGADVLYAPGLPSREAIAAVVAAVDRPVNVVAGLREPRCSVAELAELGVKRISVGSSLARAAFGAVRRAAVEMRDEGRFDFAEAAMPYSELNGLFRGYGAA
ncbi:isocitrate lyase/PEP mutase family protein [Labrys wisconsinensis]|uniref:2-methylisocitrate lyase-like PEP mutase family enzyme n=1 Tax=Labrys wisconsinensis TaxID=425677 RepID=A0ABU0JK78_9HYPH|nr:isocitrate lyase/phosphoenolpyruvate mutase family protein [Labrys wisconsinensis]MDQ0474685.1 2-methylisocitrate lyase-like PEP mutase family enzyme [Labrys wisconsinensis]